MIMQIHSVLVYQHMAAHESSSYGWGPDHSFVIRWLSCAARSRRHRPLRWHLPFCLHRAIHRCRLRPSSHESLCHHHILSISDCHIPAFHARHSSVATCYSSIEPYVLIQSNSNDPMKTLSYDTFWALWHEYSSILTYRTALPSCSHDPWDHSSSGH